MLSDEPDEPDAPDGLQVIDNRQIKLIAVYVVGCVCVSSYRYNPSYRSFLNLLIQRLQQLFNGYQLSD